MILGLLLLVGSILRVLVIVAWRPGFLGYPDSSVYLEAAQGKFVNPAIPNSVFFDRIRPAGYPIFLRILHPISHDLTFPIIVQHGLGIATAILLFLAVRRIGGPAWLGLVPAAIVLLDGTEIFAEHGALTESLYIFLQAGALYAVIRALESSGPGWAALSGFLLGAATDVRFLGIGIIPIVLVWLFFARKGSLAVRVLHAGALAAAASVLVGGYVYAQREAVGYTGLSQQGWSIYGRVAGFADCTKFQPPAGTKVLCESTPPSERPGPDAYVFGSSPATKAFGYNDWGGSRLSPPEDSRKVAAFTRAVVLNQPFDYLRAISSDLRPFFFPNDYKQRPGGGLIPSQFVADLTEPSYSDFVMQDVLPGYYSSRTYSTHPDLLSWLQTYERRTRIEGVAMIALVLLSLLGPFLATGRVRAGVSLFTVVALASMVAPVAAATYDARYAIPLFGLFGASASLGACATWASCATLLARVRAR